VKKLDGVEVTTFTDAAVDVAVEDQAALHSC
jgi:hypothetical protein